MSKKVYIETYGCQMNEYDTELVKSILTTANYAIEPNESNADIVMLNTCSVRENANNKIYNRVHEIRRAKNGAPVMVGILGCMATNFKEALLEDRGLKIDFIAGPDSYKQLPTLIGERDETGQKSFDVTLSEFETYSDVLPTRQEGINAWIAVMRGCNNFCSFCVVPFTRGRERSRDPYNVVEEVKKLVDQGFEQVTLLGQNVNSYKVDGYDFADLMAMVSDVPGVKRIRFTSPHPKDFPDKFLQVMAERDNICNQIHMPLQAGNSRVLKKMNRTYTKEEFLALIDHARAMVPGVSISTDIIVGFPTETEDEFEDTVDVVRKSQFDSAYIFKYSERKLTLASRRFPDDVPEAEKTRRIVKLNEIQRAISLEKNKAQIGQMQTLLVEHEVSKKSDLEAATRNDANNIVIIPRGNLKQGDWVQAKIVDAAVNHLKGEAVG